MVNTLPAMKRLLPFVFLLLLAAPGLLAAKRLTSCDTRQAQPARNPVARFGVNLSGAEFGGALPGTFGRDYTYPTTEELDYFRARGRTLIRLPFRWERLQRALNAPLDADELARIQAVVCAARQHKMQVILDPHSYGRYQAAGEEGQIIGSARVPVAAFADFWTKLARAFQNEPAVYAYALMNEPHDMGDDARWPRAAQAAVDAIRRVDARTPIIVPGDHWSGARGWKTSSNRDLNEKVRDPKNNLLFEAHCYFDKDNSGRYAKTYADEGGSPDAGIEYVKPFVNWCRENNVRGFVGEYGVPHTDARWLTTMDRFLAYLKANNIGAAYWSAGPWWGDYPLAIEPHGLGAGKPPKAAIDRPQMIVLRQFPG